MRIADGLDVAGKGSVAGGLDATPIGATTRATGAFTTLSSTGTATFGAGITVTGGGTFSSAVVSQGPTNYAGFFNRCNGVTSIWGHDSSTNRTTLQTYAGGTATTTGTVPYDMCLQPSGGNVGIGNGGPGERLHITGNLRVDGFAYVRAATQFTGFQVLNGSGVLVATIQGNSATNTGGTLALSDTTGATKTILRGDGADSFVSGTFRPAAYTVATLPTAGTAGRIAYATNGRAHNALGMIEAAGAGTGCMVSDSGTAWKIIGTNQTVQA